MLFVALFVVTLGLIIADAITWIELDVSTIYGLPLMLAGATRSRHLLWILAALLTITTFVVYALQIPENAFTLHETFFVNRALDVVALLFTAVLLHVWMSSVEAGEIQRRLIKDQTEKIEAANVSRRLISVQEAERRTLANKLHDLIGQKLTALSINLNIVAGQLPSSQAQIGTRLEDSLKLVEEIIENIRDVMTELRPVVLDDYGLASALRWYADHFEKRTDVVTAVIEQGIFHRLPPVTEEALFYIAQEALANVAKYAQAQEVIVRLEAMNRAISLTITDDGCGFDPTTSLHPDMHHGWGLKIMRERAAAVGAQLSIESAPGRGTRVTVKWKGSVP